MIKIMITMMMMLMIPDDRACLRPSVIVPIIMTIPTIVINVINVILILVLLVLVLVLVLVLLLLLVVVIIFQTLSYW